MSSDGLCMYEFSDNQMVLFMQLSCDGVITAIKSCHYSSSFEIAAADYMTCRVKILQM